MADPKTRFSDRAQDYARYRPGYPGEILTFLKERSALTGDSVVADVGSGTGIMSALFLQNGNRVFAVEPNEEMREAAERTHGDHPRFESVAGSAEATGLRSRSVDLVVIANSLHWVDREAARAEASRILKPEGRLAVAWNMPRRSGTPFLDDLGRLVSRYRTDGGAGGDAEDVYEKTEAFFGGSDARRDYEVGSFPSSRSLDLEALKGLERSYSSLPVGDQPGSRALLRDLEGIFRAHEAGGAVVMEYVARVYCGRLC